MNNATENNDSPDVFRADRPEWMSPDRWAEIRANTVAFIERKLDEVRDAPNVIVEEQCPERAWCMITDPEHDYHAGDIVHLANGYFCWPVEENGALRIWFESEALNWQFRVPASELLAILRAVATAGGRATLDELMATLVSEEPT
jgi:hypothetical protein